MIDYEVYEDSSIPLGKYASIDVKVYPSSLLPEPLSGKITQSLYQFQHMVQYHRMAS